MGRIGSNKIEPTPKDAVLNYKHTGKDEDGPSMDRFRADFTGGHPENSLWNIRLAKIFTNDNMRCALPFCKMKEVTHFFLAYIHSLQTAHQKVARIAASKKGNVSKGISRGRIRECKKSVRLLSPLLYNYTDTFDEIISSSKVS